MMMKRKVGILSLVLATAISCQKSENTVSPSSVEPVGSTSEMVVKDVFNWSASKQGGLNISFDNPNNVSLEQEYVHLIDAQGTLYDKQIVHNAAVTFQVVLPEDAQYFILFPYTGDKYPIKSTGNHTLSLSANVAKAGSQGKTNSSSCSSCASPFENGNMELPAIPNSTYRIVSQTTVPGWQTTSNDGKIEIWSSGFNGVPAQEGRQFYEINANNPAALYQTLCLEPGSTVKWSVFHRGRSGVDVARVRIGATVSSAVFQATMTDGKAWGYHSGSYTIPNGQTTTVFVFEAVSSSGGASYGNFIDNFRIECDRDGDGVKDTEDDYPDNPNKAYKSFFPTAGTQTVAFEDLWPSVGDYDFNDLVLNAKVEIAKNAANELVDATFKVSIDAIGAGYDNGIAMMLYKADKTAYGTDVIASVSGHASKDPANTNGLIISSNVFDDLSSYYQNNGFGPSKTSDTLNFTVVFKNGVSANVLPELYLFRADNRGLEVHRTGFPATATLNTSLVNSLDDAGNFKTANGLPWAIEVVSANKFKHPLEKVDMIDAYSQFQAWAMSLGVSNPTWYLSPNNAKVFND